jgi:PTS system galactitol-specific IIA component
MGNQKLLDKSVINLNVKAVDSDDVLAQMSDVLKEAGYVKDTFKEAIIEREKTFATGLPTDFRGIAIPHTSTEHVNQAIVSISVLEEPVSFKMMGNHDETIEVDLIFMLALKEAHAQLQMLQNLMALIQDQDLLSQARSAGSEDELMTLLDNFF